MNEFLEQTVSLLELKNKTRTDSCHEIASLFKKNYVELILGMDGFSP
jgi:hypothetical protein